MNVKFLSVKLKATFDALATKDSTALYWIDETQELYKGSLLFGTGALATEKAAGLLSKEDYVKLKALIDAGPASTLEPVNGALTIADGKIGINISKTTNNLISVNSDGLFVAVDLKPIEQRLTEVEKQAVGGIRYKGSVPTVEDLPTNPVQGDLYEIAADGSERCWNGEKWFEYGTSHFQPITGAGIDINGSTISAKISAVDGNALVIAEDNGLFVRECNFTDKDRITIDTLPMLYVTNDAMNDAISGAIENNYIAWEELGANVGVAKIGNTYYPTVQKAISAANAGDIVKIMAGDYGMIEFTDKTKSNITLLGEDGVRINKIRLTDTTNYGAPYGLTLKNITFTGAGIIASNDKINNMSVVNCDFVNGAVVHIGGGCTTNGLVIENCEFDATNSAVNSKEKTAILVQGTSKNVIIRDNNIKDCEHNAIQVVGASGSMLIDSNTINNTGSRAMRITTKDGAVLAIMNNVMTNANTNPTEAEENAGEIIKITGSVVDGAIANNIYDGNELVFNDGIGQVI